MKTFFQQRTGNLTNSVPDVPMTSANPTNTGLVGQGPLQKLLMQLQKNNTTANVNTNHVSANGNLSETQQENPGFSMLNQESLDPIKSLMNQLKIKDPVKTDGYQVHTIFWRKIIKTLLVILYLKKFWQCASKYLGMI